ncbi:MAG: M61 family metallopeptidase [Opitutaceae bacterium]|nr:M61 family metallopeptidase [Opitutaceae bacterium]
MSLYRLSFLLAWAALVGALHASPLPPVHYTLRFPDALHHYVEVEVSFPTDGQEQLEIFMPVWTPGSYLVREYARNIDRITAATPDGESLTIIKTSKNHWVIAAAGHDRVQVTYRLYGWEPNVRSNVIEGDFAMINGAPTYLTVTKNYQRPYTVRVELPEGWRGCYTPLDAGPEPHTYTAPDFDTLIDSPILAGSPQVDSFVTHGATHYLVTIGGEGRWDNPRAARNLELVVNAQIDFWGALPDTKPFYVFNLLFGSRGGLEHKQSFVITADGGLSSTRSGITSWLSLVSHEYFHLWNGKRLRPVELGPFDYEHEAYTKTLWVVEGITSYYQHLMLHRAGYYSRTDLLNALSGSIAGIERTPGRLIQSLSDASFDTWIKSYRPDENSANTRISYYSAGSVAALLLDAEIRRLSVGAKSLDDVMRTAYARYSGDHGYTEAEFIALTSEVTGADLAPWFTRIIQSPGSFDYQPMLDWFGLQFTEAAKPDDSLLPNKLEPPDPPAGWLGADLNGNLVTAVRSDTPAYAAGLYAGDEIVAIDGFRTPNDPATQLRFHPPGDCVDLLVSRRGKMLTLEARLGEAPRDTWKLMIRPNATPEQKSRLEAWLGRVAPLHESTPQTSAPIPPT